MNKVTSFEDDKMLIEFANTAFEYLNGKVNDIPAKLNIRTNFNKSLLANNIFNIVNLYLWNIEEHCNNDITKIKQSIIFNIIHELSHIGQDIDYIQYNNDYRYRLAKENVNNLATYVYLYNNQSHIESNLNVILDSIRIDKSYKYHLYIHKDSNEVYTKYSKRDYYKHCMKILLNDTRFPDMQMFIDTVFNCDEFYIIINGKFAIASLHKFDDINVSYIDEIIDKYNNHNMSACHVEVKNSLTRITLNCRLRFQHDFPLG